jgi:hypothetical protein
MVNTIPDREESFAMEGVIQFDQHLIWMLHVGPTCLADRATPIREVMKGARPRESAPDSPIPGEAPSFGNVVSSAIR